MSCFIRLSKNKEISETFFSNTKKTGMCIFHLDIYYDGMRMFQCFNSFSNKRLKLFLLLETSLLQSSNLNAEKSYLNENIDSEAGVKEML